MGGTHGGGKVEEVAQVQGDAEGVDIRCGESIAGAALWSWCIKSLP